jgi:hypothetical protein
MLIVIAVLLFFMLCALLPGLLQFVGKAVVAIVDVGILGFAAINQQQEAERIRPPQAANKGAEMTVLRRADEPALRPENAIFGPRRQAMGVCFFRTRPPPRPRFSGGLGGMSGESLPGAPPTCRDR